MSFSIQEFGVILITSSIFLLTVINVYLVWRLLKSTQQENLHLEGIAEQCTSLRIEQEKVRQLVASPPPPPEPILNEVVLQELDQALCDSQDMLEHAAGGMGDVVFELQHTDDEDLAEWKRRNEPRITELLNGRDTMRNQMDALQTLLSKANATILNLRAKAAAESSDGNNKIAEELQQARLKSMMLSGELSAASQNVQTLNSLLSARDKKLSETQTSLSKEKQKLAEERDALQRKVDELQGLIERTMVEKSFIEEAFLEVEGREKQA